MAVFGGPVIDARAGQDGYAIDLGPAILIRGVGRENKHIHAVRCGDQRAVFQEIGERTQSGNQIASLGPGRRRSWRPAPFRHFRGCLRQ